MHYALSMTTGGSLTDGNVVYSPLQGQNEFLPTRLTPFFQPFAIVQHRVREFNELPHGTHNAVGLRGVGFDHLDGTEEERIPKQATR